MDSFVFLSKGDWSLAFQRAAAVSNAPIWFLLSLFQAGILFYVIQSQKKKYNRFIILIGIAFVGFFLKKEIFPYSQTTLNAFVFYGLGCYSRTIFPILSDKLKPLLKAIILSVMFILISLYLFPIPYMHLDSIQIFPYWYFLSCGILGILSVMYISKWIDDKCMWLQKVGRYSLIILGTHLLFVRIAGFLVPYQILNRLPVRIVLLLIIMILFVPTINLFVKYFPRFCAQKPFFKIDSK